MGLEITPAIIDADNGERFRSEIIEVTSGLIAHNVGFDAWARNFLRPLLLEGKSVTVKVVRSEPGVQQ